MCERGLSSFVPRLGDFPYRERSAAASVREEVVVHARGDAAGTHRGASFYFAIVASVARITVFPKIVFIACFFGQEK